LLCTKYKSELRELHYTEQKEKLHLIQQGVSIFNLHDCFDPMTFAMSLVTYQKMTMKNIIEKLKVTNATAS